jgi:hypothetical protein
MRAPGVQVIKQVTGISEYEEADASARFSGKPMRKKEIERWAIL